MRKNLKAVCLCGGLGTRLMPLTTICNKHLLPIYNQPMIYYPIQSLVASGIKDILLVCGGHAPGEFLRIIGNGEQFGLKHVAYTYQREPRGIAHALGLAEEWANGEPVCVMLGDNILEKPFPQAVTDFKKHPQGARIFLTRVEHPEWYGVVDTDMEGKVTEIVEKPQNPKSNQIAIGLYMYDATVWDFIRSLTLSQRMELEVTDLNNKYLEAGRLKTYQVSGYWGDAGESIDGYLDCCIKVREFKKKDI